MFEGHHKIGKHPVYFSTPGIIAFMARDGECFTFSIVMADHPFAVITENQVAFMTHGTKVFAAVR
jgi:hypothetical protein